MPVAPAKTGQPVAEEARPLTTKGRQTRERIVAAAAAHIHLHGVVGTTLEDVRAAAGVSSSQLYHYFTDRRALVHAVVEAQLESVLGSQAGMRLDTADGLRAWRDGVVRHLQADGTAGGCPVGALAAELAETDEDARRDLADGFARWESLFRDGLVTMGRRGELPDGADPGTLALAMLAALQGGYLLAQVRRDVAPMVAALDTVLALAGVERTPN